MESLIRNAFVLSEQRSHFIEFAIAWNNTLFSWSIVNHCLSPPSVFLWGRKDNPAQVKEPAPPFYDHCSPSPGWRPVGWPHRSSLAWLPGHDGCQNLLVMFATRRSARRVTPEKWLRPWSLAPMKRNETRFSLFSDGRNSEILRSNNIIMWKPALKILFRNIYISIIQKKRGCWEVSSLHSINFREEVQILTQHEYSVLPSTTLYCACRYLRFPNSTTMFLCHELNY